ncbi:hypothetical protein [Leptolyngbya iicbica]|uniref:Uncharacterized protein n=2 Tax=Cyanophyceae TaxID=3028117 RepID=A0A4Q7EAB3_9CYAN|nr:hypothetical protein [Leptolyngbya sp. LK]RZM77935.1 hypothetical protein DYY88_15405 [Leptolyngbya sp. LK]
MRKGHQGWRVDFFAREAIAVRLMEVLEHPTQMQMLCEATRKPWWQSPICNRLFAPTISLHDLCFRTSVVMLSFVPSAITNEAVLRV